MVVPTNFINAMFTQGVKDFSDRDIYTFGVYTGASVKFWLERCEGSR